MNENEILNLLGKSENDKEVKMLLDKNNFSLPKAKYYVESLFGNSLNVDFRVKFSYDEIYNGTITNEDVKVPFEEYKPAYELILEGISFKDYFPFNLTQESTKEDVKKSGNVYNKPTKDLWYLIKDDYHLSINFKDDKVYHITVTKQTLSFKENLEITKQLKEQSKNIHPANIEKLADYDLLRPTINWKKNMQELSELDTDFYSVENLNKMDDILDEFYEMLKKYTLEKKASNIYNSAKKTVVSFNKLEDKYGYFTTDERESLATYINEMVMITGLKLEFDITEQWRNW
jgi:hypothetical protein